MDSNHALPSVHKLQRKWSECDDYSEECDLMEKFQQSPTSTRASGNWSGSESTRFDEESDGSISEKQATTMMICNIPCRVSQRTITEAIDQVGFAGTYDFVYLPDRRRGRPSGNLGYAFVEF